MPPGFIASTKPAIAAREIVSLEFGKERGRGPRGQKEIDGPKRPLHRRLSIAGPPWAEQAVKPKREERDDLAQVTLPGRPALAAELPFPFGRKGSYRSFRQYTLYSRIAIDQGGCAEAPSLLNSRASSSPMRRIAAGVAKVSGISGVSTALIGLSLSNPTIIPSPRAEGATSTKGFDAFICAAGFRDPDASVDRVLVNCDRPVGMSADACLDMSLADSHDL